MCLAALLLPLLFAASDAQDAFTSREEDVITGVQSNHCPRGFYTEPGPPLRCRKCQKGYFCPGCPSNDWCPAAWGGYSAYTEYRTGDNPMFPPRIPCPAGTYSSTEGMYACMTCKGAVEMEDTPSGERVGRGCNVHAAPDPEPGNVCEPAYYKTTTGDCLLCPDGHYCRDQVKNPCPEGHEAQEGGHIQCRPCPAGHREENLVCVECGQGSHQNSTGQTTCDPCPAGQVSARGQAQCGACGNGTVKEGLQCVRCRPGTYMNIEEFSDDTVCTECPVDKTSELGASACLTCPNGSSTGSQFGQPDCQFCGPGFFWKQRFPSANIPHVGSCVACAAGAFSLGSQGNAFTPPACTRCPDGHVAKPGSPACDACPAGSVVMKSMGECKPCRCTGCDVGNPDHALSVSDDNRCLCPPGFFRGRDGTQCLGCLAGQYRSGRMPQKQCRACQVGYYGGGMGRPFCTGCGQQGTTLFTGTVSENGCNPSSCTPCEWDSNLVSVCDEGGNQSMCVKFDKALPGAIGWEPNWYLDPHLKPLATILDEAYTTHRVVASPDANRVAVLAERGDDPTGRGWGFGVYSLSVADKKGTQLNLEYPNRVQGGEEGGHLGYPEVDEVGYVSISWSGDSNILFCLTSRMTIDALVVDPRSGDPGGPSCWYGDGNKLSFCFTGGWVTQLPGMSTRSPTHEGACVHAIGAGEDLGVQVCAMYSESDQKTLLWEVPIAPDGASVRGPWGVEYRLSPDTLVCEARFGAIVFVDGSNGLVVEIPRVLVWVEAAEHGAGIPLLTAYAIQPDSPNHVRKDVRMLRGPQRATHYRLLMGLLWDGQWITDAAHSTGVTPAPYQIAINGSTVRDLLFRQDGTMLVATDANELSLYAHLSPCPDGGTTRFDAHSVYDCECPHGRFQNAEGGCTECTVECPEGQYMVSACDPRADAVCAECAGCEFGQWRAGGCSGEQDTVCGDCEQEACPNGTWRAGGCTGVEDAGELHCLALDVCREGQYIVGYTTFTDGRAMDEPNVTCAECNAGCGNGQYRTNRCTGRDREDTERCLSCPLCPAGEFWSEGCDGTTFDTSGTCTACDRCGRGEYVSSFGSCLGHRSTPNSYTCSQCEPCAENGTHPSPPCDGLSRAPPQCVDCPVCGEGQRARTDPEDGGCTCENCTEVCTAGEYRNKFGCPGYRDEDDTCMPCTGADRCNEGQYVDRPGGGCDGNGDLDAEICVDCTKVTCPGLDMFRDIRLCNSTAPYGSWCVPCTKPCRDGTYLAHDCEWDRDTVCEPCTTGPCGEGMYEEYPCDGENDRVCTKCRVCQTWQYDASPSGCTDDFGNRDCRRCREGCPEGQAEVEPCSERSDMVCGAVLGKSPALFRFPRVGKEEG